MKEILLDTGIDSIKLLPFLFLTYLFMEILEHRSSDSMNKTIQKAGRLGPLWGGLLGVIPQCGFSTAASSLYAGGVITVGTLLSVFLSTSDEMFPIMISNQIPFRVIGSILLCKCTIAVVSGLAADAVNRWVSRNRVHTIHIHELCEEEGCHCEDGPVKSACKHTIRIFIYILLFSLLMNLLIAMVGEENIAGLFSAVPVVGEMISALIGLIPNCASSVIITQLYISGMITAGAMMAGLLVNAGVGLLLLFRMNRDKVKNLKILGILYGLGVFWGVVLEVLNITF